MIPAQHMKLAFAATLAAATLALPAATQAQTVTPLSVTANAPITMRVNIHGLTRAEVVNQVFNASHVVCNNAVVAIRLDIGDIGWCADRAQYKAMKQYASIVRSGSLAQTDSIVLAVR